MLARSSLLGLGLSLVACDAALSTRDAAGSGGRGSSASASSSSGAAKDAGSSCPDPPSPAVFEVGLGETCFERIVPGDSVSAVSQGPQGGFHVWAAIGCGDCGAYATVSIGLKDPATKTWFAGTVAQEYFVDLDTDGWGQHAGLAAFLPGVVGKPQTQLQKGAHVLLAGSILNQDGSAKHEAEVDLVLGDIQK